MLYFMEYIVDGRVFFYFFGELLMSHSRNDDNQYTHQPQSVASHHSLVYPRKHPTNFLLPSSRFFPSLHYCSQPEEDACPPIPNFIPLILGSSYIRCSIYDFKNTQLPNFLVLTPCISI